jgi:hypothetical protein
LQHSALTTTLPRDFQEVTFVSTDVAVKQEEWGTQRREIPFIFGERFCRKLKVFRDSLRENPFSFFIKLEWSGL